MNWENKIESAEDKLKVGCVLASLQYSLNVILPYPHIFHLTHPHCPHTFVSPSYTPGHFPSLHLPTLQELIAREANNLHICLRSLSIQIQYGRRNLEEWRFVLTIVCDNIFNYLSHRGILHDWYVGVDL